MKITRFNLIILLLGLITGCSFGPSQPDEATVTPPRSTVAFSPTATPVKPLESQPTATPLPDKPVIAYNELKEGQLTTSGEVDEWVFNAQAGERANIVLNSHFDSYLELFSPDGDFVASNDDTGSNLTAALFDLQLAQNGPYTIIVRGYNGAIGGYVLALTGGHPTVGGGVLQSGDTRAVMLTEQGYKWQFEGKKGDYLTAALNAETRVDSYLSLYGPEGTLLTGDDDSGGNLNPEIFEFELPLDGVYTLRAHTVGEPGLVTLGLNSNSQASGGGLLAADAAQSGVLKPGRTHRWEFAGKAGQVINLTMTSADFDTFVELRSAHGVILAENDDSPLASGTNSSIDLFALPADDSYSVITRGASERDGGDYQLTLEIANVKPGGGQLEPNRQVEALLGPGQTDAWLFEAEADSFVTVTLQSELLDTYLELYNSDGTLLTEDDDSGGGLNAALLNYPIVEDGAYQLVVKSARNGNEGGIYNILLTLTETIALTGRLEPGQPQQSFINKDEQHTWLFRAQAGQTVTIGMESDTLDTYLALYNSAGDLLSLNDDFRDTNAVINKFVIAEDGEYRVVARPYSAEQAGDYIISLEVSE